MLSEENCKKLVNVIVEVLGNEEAINNQINLLLNR